MAQFFNVLSFEYRAFLRKKSFWITTLLAMLVVAGVLFFPTLLARFSPDQHAPLPDGASAPVLLLQDASHDGKTAQAFAQALPHYQWVDAADVSLAADTADAFASRITSALEEERYHAALFIAPDGTLTWIQKRIQMMGDETTIVQETAQRILTEHKLAAWGLSPAQTQDALTKPTLQVIETGKSMTQTYLYTYAMIFLLYFSLVLYGTMIASNVATEKSSRTMEVLITSARPINLLFGKVIGTCLAGLTQLTVILLTCVLCYRMAMPAWAGNPLIAALFDIPAHILFAMIGFYLLGFFLYGFLYGGLGSLANRAEDVSGLTMPLMLLIIVAFLLAAMGLFMPDSTLTRVCSFIPFFAPMVLFVRVAMTEVPWYEITISIFLTVLTTLLLGWLGARIYRMGILLYGTKPTLRTLLCALTHQDR